MEVVTTRTVLVGLGELKHDDPSILIGAKSRPCRAQWAKQAQYNAGAGG